jgi:hypothetical protein
MKRLGYLKKFNEASSEECDYETFKEIMMELSDYFECNFHDYTKEGDYFYDCELTIPQISDEEVDEKGTYLTARYLTEVGRDYWVYLKYSIPPTDDPDNIESIYRPLSELTINLKIYKN